VRMRRLSRTGAWGLAVAAVAVAAVGCRPTPDFYEVPDPVPASPGEVVRTLEVLFDKAADVDGTALLYSSTSATGSPNVVSGTVYTPKEAWAGPGSRPVVAFAPGTQGMGDRCAPSQTMPIGKYYELGAVRALLDRGWAVAVTDYEKLGTAGDHTYMVKDAEAHALLDIVRAAQKIPETGVAADSPVGLWGYSQGGQAASAAAEVEATYAPELEVAGVVAGGVPADLAVMTEHLDGEANQFFSFLAFASVGLDSAYSELDLESYLNAEGSEVLSQSREGRGVCLEDGLPLLAGRHIADLTTANPLETPEWQARIAEQDLGTAVPAVPVFLFHGSSDQIVPPTLGEGLRDSWCAGGASVQWQSYPVDHLIGINAGTADGATYLAARFAGEAPPSTCGA
jgi:pimeloyl-ACP methyl ester carboxylesterase